MKYLESLNATFVIDTFLLLLIGVGPKIALVPFLDVTAGMSEATKRRVQRKMLTTAATVAVILLVLGGLLTRLLHFTPGALGIASGIILLIIAVTMVLSQQGGNGGSHPVKRPGPDAGRRVPAWPCPTCSTRPGSSPWSPCRRKPAHSWCTRSQLVYLSWCSRSISRCSRRAVQVSNKLDASRMLLPCLGHDGGSSTSTPRVPRLLARSHRIAGLGPIS
jgi:hypothetical protein